MASKQKIKTRIKSVDSTKKITKAMQLVAASKLRRCKERMIENREYAKYLKETVDSILASIENLDHPYLLHNETALPITIVFTSDMGLCGAYNGNVYKLLMNEVKKNEPLVVLGSRGISWAKHNGYHISEELYNVDEEGYEVIAALADKALELFTSGEIGSIRIVYTHFKNAVTFEPQLKVLLPVEKTEANRDDNPDNVDTIFEPAGEKILDDLVPMYLKSLLYSYWLETKTSEQASRQSAMESATDNAEELRDVLELEFNKARQAAITQEITEIVGGANAL